MSITLKQISSLNKVTSRASLDIKEINNVKVMQGERFSYQIAINVQELQAIAKVWTESSLDGALKLYRVKEVYVDKPAIGDISNDDYILKQPGFLPDVLIPMDAQDNKITVWGENVLVWVKVDIPKDATPGKYWIDFHVDALKFGTMTETITEQSSCRMEIEIIPAVMPEQKLIYTRWFYADCIADAHDVEIYSEAHWKLIESYIALAADVGVNMILTPTHTPPLDTEVGTTRPCVQLVDIEKKGDIYDFGFDKLERFVGICKKHGIKYYEMAHLFSQWGATSAPNIKVLENGKLYYMFGWHTAANSPEYVDFLKQYIKAISEELEKLGIASNTYFHVSDEPHPDNLDRYQIAQSIIKPLIGKSKTFDALSHVEFYDKGLVECPVTSIKAIEPFLERKIENQWAYYCCGPETVYTNSFIAMPSGRTRMLGYQLYKYDIKGFLHWGLNFYNACRSLYKINPYLTTSADGCFPSGDGFIIYPGKGEAYPSIRGEVTYQAIQDINVCVALEAIIGREKVVEMIDNAAGRDMKFHDYPTAPYFTEELHAQMIEMIAANK